MSRDALLKKILAKKELERRKREEALRYYRPHPKQRLVHQSTKRLLGIFGGNRCLDGDTLVLRPDGSKTPIKDLRPGDEVLAYDTERGVLVPSKVVRLYENGPKPVYRFVFGRYQQEVSVVCTEDHKILTETESHKIVKVRPIGKISRRRTAALRAGGGDWGRREPRALLLGLLIGDGCINGRITFTCADESLIQDITPYLQSIGVEFRRNSGNPIQYGVIAPRTPPERDELGRLVKGGGKSELRVWLESLGLYGKKSQEKFIPQEVWSWDKQSVEEFVAGLIASDGSGFVTQGFAHVCYSSRSLRLIQELKHLLEVRLGIYGSAITGRGDKHGYNLTFGTYEALQRFARLPIPGAKGRRIKEIANLPVRKGSRSSRLPFRRKEYVGVRETYDILIDHPSHLFAIDGGLIVSNSGKSTVGAIEDVLQALGRDAEPYIQSWEDEDKEWWYRRFYHIRGDQRIWVATENWDVQREVIQEKIRHFIPKPILEKCDIAWRKKGVMDFISLPNGSRITFKSYETGADGFQGASLDLLHFDEEPDMQIWQEGEKRVLDRKGRIILTMTPLKGLTYIYSRVYTNTTDPEVFVVEISWDDNPYLDEGEKQRLLANMSEDEIAARVHGKFLVGGQTVFNAPKLMERRNQVKPGKKFEFSPSDNKFRPAYSDKVPLDIWEEPQPGFRYVIGVDTAEGLPHGDNSVACVLDARSGRQVAELVCKEEPSQFARMVNTLGRWYNDALIVVERNKDGLAVLSRLDEDFLYPRLYVHEEDQRYGWPNNAKTRPLLIAKGQEMVRDAVETINSRMLIEEMLTFIRNKVGRPEAAGKGKPGGMKDDRVFAWMLAVWGREFADIGTLPPIIPRRTETPSSPWDDDDKDSPKGDYARWDPRFFVRL